MAIELTETAAREIETIVKQQELDAEKVHIQRSEQPLNRLAVIRRHWRCASHRRRRDASGVLCVPVR